MSRIEHNFDHLERFGDGRPRWWLLQIDGSTCLYTSEQLARGELDVVLPHQFVTDKDGWPKLLKALLRHHRWRCQARGLSAPVYLPLPEITDTHDNPSTHSPRN